MAVTVTMAVAVVVVAVASSMLEVLGILALTFLRSPVGCEILPKLKRNLRPIVD